MKRQRLAAAFVIIMVVLVIWVVTRYARPMFLRDSADGYLAIWRSYYHEFMIKPSIIETRTGEKKVRHITGDVGFVLGVMHGIDKPRFVVDIPNSPFYTVICHPVDQQATEEVAAVLGCELVQDKRMMEVIVMEFSKEDKDNPTKVAEANKRPMEGNVAFGDGRWRFDGYSLDSIARYIEESLRVPVENNTKAEGPWLLEMTVEMQAQIPKNLGERVNLKASKLVLTREMREIDVVVLRRKS